MKLYEILDSGRRILEDNGVPDPDVDAELLWQYVSGMNKLDIIMNRGEDIPSDIADRYMRAISERRSRIPLQYITGVQNFMGYDFDTSENVLIPRMDTETLVETALKIADTYGDDRITVLDMCCGSGCIGVSFGMMKPESDITMADISPYALELTRRNIRKICSDDVRFHVVKSDLFEGISGQYDLILSNPPYIKSSVIDMLMPEVRDHEPRLALDGMQDGLYFYRIIAAKARDYIKDEGYVVFEIGNDQAEDVQHLFVESGYDDIHLVQDLSNNDRVVYGRYKRSN